jgi:hypothetical protein
MQYFIKIRNKLHIHNIDIKSTIIGYLILTKNSERERFVHFVAEDVNFALSNARANAYFLYRLL